MARYRIRSSVFPFLLLLVLLASCGYRWQPEYPTASRPTIAVPFASGDDDGAFTNEIVRAFASSGLADIRLRDADFRLQVAILNTTTETIGYRKDRQKVDGKIKRNMVGDEGRKIISIEATLFKGGTDEIAYGPYSITADADYDFVDGDSYQDLTFVDPKGITQAVLPFSRPAGIA